MRRCCLLLVCLLLLTGCGRADTQDVSSFAPAEGDRLVIFTSHKETIYEPILKEFEQRTGIWVELETGGTVTLLERIAAGESGADLMFGGGADSLSAYSACFAPYVSEYAGDVAPEYDLGGGMMGDRIVGNGKGIFAGFLQGGELVPADAQQFGELLLGQRFFGLRCLLYVAHCKPPFLLSGPWPVGVKTPLHAECNNRRKRTGAQRACPSADTAYLEIAVIS